MPLPLSDISQAYRSAPERTEQALTKVGRPTCWHSDSYVPVSFCLKNKKTKYQRRMLCLFAAGR